MTNMKRILSLLLAGLMLVGVLVGTVACADNGNDNETTASTGNETTAVADEAETAYAAMEKENFGNRKFTILTREDLIDDMKIEAIIGEVLDDELFARNTAVSTDFGIQFEYFTDDDLHSLNQKMINQVSGGLDEYDMYIGHKFSFSALAQQNYCYNLNKITSLSLDEPWWDQNCYDSLTIDGKTYMMTGDINPSSMRISACYIFNKDLMRDIKGGEQSIKDINALAKNGGWTLDKLNEYCQDVSNDLNGDGNMNYENDRYCLTSWMMDVPFSMYYGAGSQYVEVVDGMPELTFLGNSNERIVDIYSKIYSIIIEKNAYFVTDSNIWTTAYDVFRDGRALFCDITLGKINTYIANVGMEDEYGILPMPKYNEAQPEYLSFVNGASAFVMVSSSEQDPEFVGTIMEAMATYNYDKVSPKMFEVVTKLQVAQDPDSAAMVDRIIYNRIYDLAYFYDFNSGNLVLNGLKEKKATIAATLKAAQSADAKKLTDLLKAYAKCD